MKISTPEFNFAGISDSVGLYQPSTTASGNGWSNLKGSWVIGNGGKYVNSIDSFTEAFFTAPIGTNINMVLMSLSIPNSDLISSTCLSRAAVMLKTSSLVLRAVMAPRRSMGSLEGDDCQGNLFLHHKSRKFFVSLMFTSDEGLGFIGATINTFTISAA
ncbi:hypothetical protein BASA83_002757 [Batrachochytrium salamandrivorans]|nr:hypothetical protein BASA83_002757 [Batrachochytrium salamandrivorans]